MFPIFQDTIAYFLSSSSSRVSWPDLTGPRRPSSPPRMGKDVKEPLRSVDTDALGARLRFPAASEAGASGAPSSRAAS